jgi:aldose 1-epimerase
MASVNKIQEVTRNNQSVEVYELKSGNGTTAVITNYGGIIMKLIVKDKNGEARDVVLGFDSVEDYWSEEYLKGYPYFGAIIGRYANRIKGASFPLNGETIKVTANTGTNILHGGKEGFDQKVWKVVKTETSPEASITLQYISADGEEGFPGELTTTVTFIVKDNELAYEVEASTNKTTVINLAHHGYFNLDKNHSSVGQQKVKLNADYWLEQDADFCVTGKLIPALNTNYDFSSWKTVSQEWNKDDGYDQTFVINRSNNDLILAAEALSSDEALHMQVYTTEPVVHLYTGKWIPVIKGKNGEQYQGYCAYCFETQHQPNAVNVPAFPSTVLNPGEKYSQANSYRFV